MTERPYHHGNLRSALLARAAEVIDREGADALSIRQLARDLGVSHGASARHFRDKQALLDAVAVEGFRELNTVLAEASTSGGAFADRFSSVGEAYVRFAVERPAILGVMYRAKHHSDASLELIELSGAGMRGLVDLITAGREAGELRRDRSPEQQALVAFATVHGVATLATDDLLDGVPWQDAAGEAIAFLWRGLRR